MLVSGKERKTGYAMIRKIRMAQLAWGQFHNPGIRNICDEIRVQIVPADAFFNYLRVPGDHMIQFLQCIICIMNHPEFNWKRKCFCTCSNVFLESAAVGNRFINPEHCGCGLLFFQLIQDTGNCFIGCGNDGIGPGKAGKVTDAPIHAAKKDAVGESGFHDHDSIKGINIYSASRIEMIHLFLLSELQPIGTCSHASKRIALTLCEQPMIGRKSDC